MRERPILFSGPMVRAILEGRKTQTRRVVKSQPEEEWCPEVGMYAPPMVDRYGEECPGLDVFGASDEYQGRVCLHGQPGDRLWVRETFQPLWNEHHEETPNWKTGEGYAISYVATSGRQEYDDDEHGLTDRCKPAIFMPRWASRITLEITEVRVQRLQEISEEDAKAEGTQEPSLRELGGMLKQAAWSERQVFQRLWDSINAKRGFGWDKNPWVWALTFKPLSRSRPPGQK